MKENNKGEFDGLPNQDQETVQLSLNLCFSKLQTVTHLCIIKSIQWVMPCVWERENGRIGVGSEGRGLGGATTQCKHKGSLGKDLKMYSAYTLSCDRNGLFNYRL